MHWLRRYPSLRRLHGVDTAKAVALCERHPVDSVLLRVAIEQTGIGASFSLGRFDADRELTALAWEYGNILPLGFDEDGLDEVAEEFAGRRRTGSSIVGPADQVMGLWNRICKRWGPARDVRERQFSMVMDSDPDVVADPLVQPAGVGDVSLVFPASVAMYIEEVGYDPTSHGAGYAYRVARLVRSQHTFIRKAPWPTAPARGSSSRPTSGRWPGAWRSSRVCGWRPTCADAASRRPGSRPWSNSSGSGSRRRSPCTSTITTRPR